MKKTISTILCIFLIIPFLSEAAGVLKPLPKLKTPSYRPPAFKEKIPMNIKIGDYAVAPEVAKYFPRDVLRAFGNKTFSGKDAYTAVQYFEKMPAVSVRLQNRGVSAEKLARMKKAFAAAAIQSAEWEDPEAQDQVVEIVDRLAQPGGYEQNKEQVDRIMGDCELMI